MADNEKIPERHELLGSWKEIANYLGKGVRTVQRYEIQFGLPVRRPAGRSRTSVLATRAELDAWVAASPIRSEFLLTRSGFSSTSQAREGVKQAIHEMQKLRRQTADLRAEMWGAMHLLLASLETLRDEVNALPEANGTPGGRSKGSSISRSKCFDGDFPLNKNFQTLAKPQ